jgi:hypothetical protein
MILGILAVGTIRAEGTDPVENAAPKDEKKVEKTDTWADFLKPIRFGTLIYASYGHGKSKGEEFDRFTVGRGYLTVQFKPLKWFESRVTLDTHQDDEGSWSVRLKYLYGKFTLPVETVAVTEPNIEIGIVHTPWFDFQENVNNYRMQGTMFIERNGLLNSADVGITISALIGRKLDKAYQEKVSSAYPGKYGSISLGLYNGGGYAAKENNRNKVFESRVTLRPLGFIFPNLQISYFFVYGRGNTSTSPTWMVNDFMLSIEHEYFVLTGELTLGKGNQKGDKVDANGKALDYRGYSFFAEVKLPWIMSSLIGRYDRFDWDTHGGESATHRIIAGYAFHFFKKNIILIDMDRLSYSNANIPTDWQAKLTLQVQYP